MEIRELLQRGGDEEQIRNNPRYADLDDYQRERAILRGRDLGNRRDRVRMAGILSQGGRLPYGQAAAAGDRFLRMDPQEQQDFLAAGGFNPMARGPMQDMAARQQFRREMERDAAQAQHRLAAIREEGGLNLRGREMDGQVRRDIAGMERDTTQRGQDITERGATADRELRWQEVTTKIVQAEAERKQALQVGNADRAAAAAARGAELRQRAAEMRAGVDRASESNKTQLEVERIRNPAVLDPLDAVDRSATALAIPKLNEIVGRERSRGASRAQARAAIKRDPVAALASEQEITRVLGRVYPK
jgi:hypothetical protein